MTLRHKLGREAEGGGAEGVDQEQDMSMEAAQKLVARDGDGAERRAVLAAPSGKVRGTLTSLRSEKSARLLENLQRAAITCVMMTGVSDAASGQCLQAAGCCPQRSGHLCQRNSPHSGMQHTNTLYCALILSSRGCHPKRSAALLSVAMKSVQREKQFAGTDYLYRGLCCAREDPCWLIVSSADIQSSSCAYRATQLNVGAKDYTPGRGFPLPSGQVRDVLKGSCMV